MKLFIIICIFCINAFAIHALDNVILKLNGKHQFKFAGFYMAQEKGFYHNVGLNVDIREEEKSILYKNKVLINEHTFGIYDSKLIFEKMIDEEISLLGAILQHSPLVFLTLKKSKIDSIEKFKNKKLMLDWKFGNDILVNTILKNFNLNIKNMKLLQTSNNINDLISGKVDIYTSYSGNERYDLEERGILYNEIYPKDLGFDLYGDILFTSGNNIKYNPMQVSNFYSASIKGWEYAFNNIEETTRFILNKYNIQKFASNKYIYELNNIKELSEIEKGKFGKIELNKINNILSAYFLSKNNFSLKNINNLNINSLLKDIETKRNILNKEVQIELSSLIKKSFYEMNNEQIEDIIDVFLKRENIMAIQLYDTLIDEITFSSWKSNNKIVHIESNALPSNFVDKYIKKEEKIIYNNKIIGSISVFYKKMPGLLVSEQNYLENKKEITLCINPDFVPFESFDKHGNYIGLASSYYKIFENKLKIPIRVIKSKSISDSLKLVKERKCDIISIAKNKSLGFNLTKPFLKTPIVIATRHNAPFISYFTNLKNEKIGIPKNHIYLNEIKKLYPNINLIEVPSLKEGLNMVKNKSLYGQIGTLAAIGYSFQNFFIGELKIAGKSDDIRLELGIGVRNDEPILYNLLEKQIDLINDSTHQEILNNWIKIKYEQSINYELLWKIFIVILLFFLLFLYLQFLSKKVNKNLEKTIKLEIEKNKQKEKILFQQSKLASMGEMLNNISHQWRQPLNAINSNVAVLDCILRKDNIENVSLENNLVEIENQTKYMSDTIESFRNYLYPDKCKTKFLMSEAVLDTLSIIKYSFDNLNVKIDIVNIEDSEVEGYLGEYIQTLISILNNSKDAFEQNNTKDAKIVITINKLVIIEDNAGGIDKDIIDRIFEPYFTTRHKNKGTGTGLYMAKMLIENSMYGELSVENIENGCRFKIKI